MKENLYIFQLICFLRLIFFKAKGYLLILKVFLLIILYIPLVILSTLLFCLFFKKFVLVYPKAIY